MPLHSIVIRIGADGVVRLLAGNNPVSMATIASGALPHDFIVDHPHLGGPTTKDVLDVARSMPSPASISRAGEYLFHLLHEAGIGAAWDRLRREHPGDGTIAGGLRTVLAIDHPILGQWHWELMSCDGRRMFMDRVNGIVRARTDPHCACAETMWPIRVLVVVGAEPEDKIGWMDEVEALDEAFHDRRQGIDLEVLRQPSRQNLERFYAEFQPHVLHFVGHARQEAGLSVLEVWDGTAGQWDLQPSVLEAMLAAHPPKLVFLNACRSGAASEQASLTFAAASFSAHARAVVTMRADVRGEVAAAFAAKFYKDLALGVEVDRAMTAARNEIASLSGMTDARLDWSFGSLEVSDSQLGGPMLTFQAVDQAVHDQLALIQEFADMRDFVDRTIERRTVFSAIDPSPDTLQPRVTRNLLIVRGPGQVGKTSVVYWGLEGCARRDYQFTHVDFSVGPEPRTANFIDVLRRIRDGGMPPSDLRRPLASQHFWSFNWILNEVLSGRDPNASDPPPSDQAVADMRLGVPRDPPEEMIPAIFTAFATALTHAAAARPLIIALDHLGRAPGGVSSQEFIHLLRPHFIEPILKGHVHNVRLVLIVDDGEFRQFELDTLESRAHVVRVSPFDQDLFVPLGRLFMRRYQKRGAAVDQILKLVPQATPGPWTPGRLAAARQLLVR